MFDLVESTTMTVSPNRTMLPPIWVAACDSQRRRKPGLRKTGSGPASAGSASSGRTLWARGRSPQPSRRRAARRGRRHRGRHGRVATGHELDEALLEHPPLEEHVAAAGLAAQPDVGAEPIHEPRAPAARMGSAEAHDVAEKDLEDGSLGHRRVSVSKAGAHAPGRASAGSPAARCDRPA